MINMKRVGKLMFTDFDGLYNCYQDCGWVLKELLYPRPIVYRGPQRCQRLGFSSKKKFSWLLLGTNFGVSKYLLIFFRSLFTCSGKKWYQKQGLHKSRCCPHRWSAPCPNRRLSLKSFKRKCVYGQAFWDHRGNFGCIVVERYLMPNTKHIHFRRNLITEF